MFAFSVLGGNAILISVVRIIQVYKESAIKSC